MSFFLAMDAGGTKTDYVLADETSELVRVRTGTIKRLRTDSETAARNLDSALSQITSQSLPEMMSGLCPSRLPEASWRRFRLSVKP
jgi:glucosamine kinase